MTHTRRGRRHSWGAVRSRSLWIVLLLMTVGIGGVAYPQDPLARSEALIMAGRYAEAEALLRGSPTAQGDPRGQYLLGFTLIQLYRYDEAEPLLREAVAQRPREHRWLHALAKSLIDQGKNRGAIEILDEAIRLEPAPEYHFAKAMCALNMAEPGLAEAELRKCLAQAPDHAESLYNLGKIHIDRGEYEPSLDHRRRCLAINPGHLEARFLLGLAESRAGSLEAAVAAFEQVIDQVPGHVGALYNLGRTHMDQGNIQEGRRRLTEFREASRLEDDIVFKTRLVEKNPTLPDGRILLAELQLQAGRTTDALAQLLAARQLAPRNARIYILMGEAFRRLGRDEDAVKAESYARSLPREP